MRELDRFAEKSAPQRCSAEIEDSKNARAWRGC